MLQISLNSAFFWVTAAVGYCVAVGAQEATLACLNPADGDEFLFFETELNFFEAVDFCANFGPGITLARVGNAVTADILRRANDFDPNFWVGIFDKFLIGGKDNTTRFSFVDGTTEELPFIHGTPGEDPWEDRQPNDGGAGIEGCVLFRANDGTFEDKPCSEERPFACRRICPSDLPATNTPTLSPTSQVPATNAPTLSPTSEVAATNAPTLSPTTAKENDVGSLLKDDNIAGQALFGTGFLLIFAIIVYSLVIINQERERIAEIKLLLEDDMIEPSQKHEAPKEQDSLSERVIEIDASAALDPLRFSIESRPVSLKTNDI